MKKWETIKTEDGVKVRNGTPLFYFYGYMQGTVVSFNDELDALVMDNGDLLYVDYMFYAKKSNRKFADEESAKKKIDEMNIERKLLDKQFISRQLKKVIHQTSK